MRNESLVNLKNILVDIRLLDLSYQQCIDWAVNELLNGEENLDVCILAGSNINDIDEIEDCIKKILSCNYKNDNQTLEERAGMIIIEYGKMYFNKEVSSHEFNQLLDKLNAKLNYPDWLVILSRNCEYSTDIYDFVVPFEKELKYIMNLWADYCNYDDFYKNYERSISNSNS